VRIDANTLIEVSFDISDEEARERYFNRHTPLRERNIPPLVQKTKKFLDTGDPSELMEAGVKPENIPIEEVIDTYFEEEE
jgi:hypothetical protein